VSECDRESSITRRPWPTGLLRHSITIIIITIYNFNRNMRVGKQWWLDQMGVDPHISQSKLCKSLIYLLNTYYIRMGPSNFSATGLSTIDNALNNVSPCLSSPWL
jgi:hypothetical protein